MRGRPGGGGGGGAADGRGRREETLGAREDARAPWNRDGRSTPRALDGAARRRRASRARCLCDRDGAPPQRTPAPTADWAPYAATASVRDISSRASSAVSNSHQRGVGRSGRVLSGIDHTSARFRLGSPITRAKCSTTLMDGRRSRKITTRWLLKYESKTQKPTRAPVEAFVALARAAVRRTTTRVSLLGDDLQRLSLLLAAPAPVVLPRPVSPRPRPRLTRAVPARLLGVSPRRVGGGEALGDAAHGRARARLPRRRPRRRHLRRRLARRRPRRRERRRERKRRERLGDGAEKLRVRVGLARRPRPRPRVARAGRARRRPAEPRGDARRALQHESRRGDVERRTPPPSPPPPNPPRPRPRRDRPPGPPDARPPAPPPPPPARRRSPPPPTARARG